MQVELTVVWQWRDVFLHLGFAVQNMYIYWGMEYKYGYMHLARKNINTNLEIQSLGSLTLDMYELRPSPFNIHTDPPPPYTQTYRKTSVLFDTLSPFDTECFHNPILHDMSVW